MGEQRNDNAELRASLVQTQTNRSGCPSEELGWGASLGAFVGAAIGARSKNGGLSAWIRQVISSNSRTTVAKTQTER